MSSPASTPITMHLIPATVLLCALPLAASGDRSGQSKVSGSGVAGSGACPCIEDLNHDGIVDGGDLGLMLAAWGPAGRREPADLTFDGIVDGADLGLLLAAWGPCAVLPANDLCQDAIPIGVGVTPFCTYGATNSGPPFPQGSPCTMFGFDSIDSDIWFSYTPTAFGDLTVSTCGTAWDTRIAVYHSAFSEPITPCPTGGFQLVAIVGCSDDAPGCGLASKTTFSVFPESEYKIRVGGYIGYAGEGALTLDFVGAGSTCEDAFDITVSGENEEVVLGDTSDNLVALDTSPCNTGSSGGEWFQFIARCGLQNPHLTLSTCDPATDFDTVISVWKKGDAGCVGQFVACNDDFVDASCQIGGLNRKSRLTFATDTGQVYMIRVSGYQGASGKFSLHVTENCD